MTYSAEVLADSPLIYPRFGEASGTTAVDASGNGRDMTYQNTPTLGVAGALTGDSDTAVTFNGTDEYASINYAAWMNGLTALTIECWYKGTDASGSLVARGGNPANYRIGITGSKAFIEVNTSSGGAQLTSSTTSVDDDTWHHIVGTWDGSNLRIYVNTALENTLAKTGTLSATTNNLRVAQRQGDSFIAGTIDEPAVYGTALSGTRITAHYDAGVSSAIDLAPADSAHGHAAESPALTQTHELAPVDSAHAHSAESPALTQVHELAPADSVHGHASETPALTQAHELAPSDSAHSHAAESPGLTQVHEVGPADSAHAHASESPALTQVHGVTPAESVHEHAAESTTVTTTGSSLTPNDSAHAHAAESPALTQVHFLTPDDSFHAHAAEDAALTQLHLLVPADSLHAHAIDATSVTGTLPTPAARTSTAVASSRTSVATSPDRTSTTSASSRTSSSN